MKHKENECLELNLILKHKGYYGICHVPSGVCSELFWWHTVFATSQPEHVRTKEEGAKNQNRYCSLLVTSCYT